MALLFPGLFQQIYCLSPVEIGAGRENSIYKAHWRRIRSAKGWRIHGSDEGLVRKSLGCRVKLGEKTKAASEVRKSFFGLKSVARRSGILLASCWPIDCK